MADPRAKPQWRSAVDLPLIVLATATVLSLDPVDRPAQFHRRDRRQRGRRSCSPTRRSRVLAGFCLQRLLGSGSLPRPARAVAIAAAAFSAWLFLSSAANGADAVDRRRQAARVRRARARLRPLRAPAAAALAARGRARRASPSSPSRYGLLAFFDAPFVESRFPGRRQPSFLGEHDLAALVDDDARGRARRRCSRPRTASGRLPLVAGIAGAIGVVLGAAVAGLLGLYLAVGAILAVGGRARGGDEARGRWSRWP